MEMGHGFGVRVAEVALMQIEVAFTGGHVQGPQNLLQVRCIVTDGASGTQA